MRCFDKDQAERRVRDAQAETLRGIASVVERADGLDEAAVWLHGDDVDHVRRAVAGMRELIAAARVIEQDLDTANEQRRIREAARRIEASVDDSVKIEVRPR